MAKFARPILNPGIGTIFGIKVSRKDKISAADVNNPRNAIFLTFINLIEPKHQILHYLMILLLPDDEEDR